MILTNRFALSLLLLLAPSAAWTQGQHPVTKRKIAGVMGYTGADWLERGEREREESPAKAIEALNFKAGMIVADVGAGTGYYALRIAKLVGPEGKVYATDVQPEMIRLFEEKRKEAGVTNAVSVLGTDSDPKLPAGLIDMILLVDVYHEFSKPQEMVRKLREALKPDGRLVLLEFRKEDPKVPIRAEHKMSIAEVKAEMEPEGMEIDRVLEVLPWQHIIILRKKP